MKVPSEVFWVWALQFIGHPVGRGMHDKAVEIVRANPEWFPWEHTYASVPNEVHDAFHKEAYPERMEKIEKWSDIIDNAEPIKYNIDVRDLQQIVDDMFLIREKEKAAKRARKKRITKIWNKHYKKYGLECREKF